MGRSNFKKIEDTVGNSLYDKMHARLRNANAKTMKKLRQSTVEPQAGYIGELRCHAKSEHLRASTCVV